MKARLTVLVSMIVLLPAAFLLASCGSETTSEYGSCPDADADGDSDSDADSDADTDTSDDCPAPVAESCAEEVENLPVLLEASDLGEGVRFAAIERFSLLAVRENGDSAAVLLYAATEDPGLGDYFSLEACGTAELAVDPGVEIRALGSSNPGEYGDGPWQIALICLDDECALYGAQIAAGETTTLEPLENGTVPCGPDIRGMFARSKICAYGRGVCCFDGTDWTVHVEPEADLPLLNDMDFVYPDFVAVGQQGRFVRFGDGALSDTWSAELPDYLGIVGDNSEYAIVTAGGGLILADGDFPADACPVADEEIVGFDARTDNFDPGLFGVTASGRIFRSSGEPMETSGLCFTGQEVVAPLAALVSQCGCAENQLVLSETTLYGIDFCPIE